MHYEEYMPHNRKDVKTVMVERADKRFVLQLDFPFNTQITASFANNNNNNNKGTF